MANAVYHKRDLYSEVTRRILAELAAGAPPWVKPWSATPGRNHPHNAATGRPYSGCNVVLLWMTAKANGWGEPRFLTFRHVVRVVDRSINSLAGHAHLSPFCVEVAIRFEPSSVVGHIVTDIKANSHCVLLRFRICHGCGRCASGGLGLGRRYCQPALSGLD